MRSIVRVQNLAPFCYAHSSETVCALIRFLRSTVLCRCEIYTHNIPTYTQTRPPVPCVRQEIPISPHLYAKKETIRLQPRKTWSKLENLRHRRLRRHQKKTTNVQKQALKSKHTTFYRSKQTKNDDPKNRVFLRSQFGSFYPVDSLDFSCSHTYPHRSTPSSFPRC